MTAPQTRIRADVAERHIDETCQSAIDGRRAARALGEWTAPLQLTEPELQILWCLRRTESQGVDQTTLATRLAFSPAQMSACVEKLRARGLISQHAALGDRRRRLWQICATGNDALQKIAESAGERLLTSEMSKKHAEANVVSREAAA